MPDVHQDILDWLHRQQDWLQEAAEKLLSSGSLTEADIETIAECLKTPAGQKVTTHRMFDGLRNVSTSEAELRLVEIGEIIGIENLVPRSPLTFGDGNLVVIYGRNGSGKSGYTRILKHACGKPQTTNLQSNVFQSPPDKQQCTIRYRRTGTDQSVIWQANGAPINDIRAVDIFDADASTFYLSQETEASYTPPSVTLFKELAAVCDRAKVRLQDEQNRLVSTLPTLPPVYRETMAGTTYTSLNPDVNTVVVQGLIDWTENDQNTMDQLTERLKTGDPIALAREKRNTKIQIDQFAVQLRNAVTAVSPEQLEAIRNAREAARQKRRIAIESAQIGSAQFDGIGSSTWKALWQAAREYSQMVYPGQNYPVTDNDARCVLCHQLLTMEAQQRLHDFEAFVRGKVEGEAQVAERTYKTMLENLPAILNQEDIRTRCEAAGLTEDGWPDRFWAVWAKVSKARECLLNDESQEKAVAVEEPDGILSELAQRAERIEHEAKQHDEDAKNFDRDKAEKERLNLEARRWTAEQAAAIESEISRLKIVKDYECWKKLANSSGISLQAGKIAERVITQSYVDRFNRELKALGASQIKVELIKSRTRKGEALHRLRLRGVQRGYEDIPESVLSEGERRIVSLAAFLADVAGNPYASPFIFDDPISSLDQDFEWHVAKRLARLAKNRQVIVFTHRLSLYGAIEDAAKKIGGDWKQEHLYLNCIESFSGTTGHPADQQVWNANTKKANNILLERLDKAKEAGEQGGADAYKRHAQGICTDFRKLLERTVEDDLLHKIVKRHRRSVTTDNLLVRLPNIRQEDCIFIDDLMTKYSCYEHSQSQESPSFLPEEPELRADLESLKRWRTEFSKRPVEVSA